MLIQQVGLYTSTNTPAVNNPTARVEMFRKLHLTYILIDTIRSGITVVRNDKLRTFTKYGYEMFNC